MGTLLPTPVNDSNKPTSKIYLPYIPKITSKLKKVCLKNNLRVVFTSNLSIVNLLNSGKDKTPVTRLRGACQIPCSCVDVKLLHWSNPPKFRNKITATQRKY